MLVSIVIAAYNAEAWLAETLDSAVAQTWPHAEVILVDDGSTDRTPEIARRYEAAGVKVLRQENQGACAARNRGLREVQGEFIQFLDADDVLAPDKVERQMRRLAEAPEDTVASGPWSRFYNGDLAADRSWRGPDWRDYERATGWLVESWTGRGTIPSFSWLAPRAVVERAGPWTEGLLRNQDGEYFTRVLVEASGIAFVEGAWGYYRSGLPNSVSHGESEAVLRSLYHAAKLCERTLLGHEDTAATRRACAGLWQQFLFTAYPHVPDLVRRAEVRVEELGGMYRKPGVIRPLRLVRDVLGWKPALRLQHAYVHSGAQEVVQRIKAGAVYPTQPVSRRVGVPQPASRAVPAGGVAGA